MHCAAVSLPDPGTPRKAGMRPPERVLFMQAREKPTAIYLVCFHSEPRDSLNGCKGQYLAVETAILNAEWPYDNGDDPSFYVARRGGPLTWGVCRADLRNKISKSSIVVFFSFTPGMKDETVYRLCAVETVVDKVDHRSIYVDHRFSGFPGLYINGLIAPENGGWRHEETDRPRADQHTDWLWRIGDRSKTGHVKFKQQHAATYLDGKFSESAVQLARNYVIFSSPPDRALISAVPPIVATAVNGQHEIWIDAKLKELTGA